ncbi:MAG: CDP-glycerol glycerophosphotransferase family protein [Candidatus Cloacimonetes bacterium]|nr:CDP-glycerol glycerophosphotransferase family protein [Candidatus Cloacimonadota bacterium]
MVFSYYLLKPFYSTMWRLLDIFKKREETVFYCHTMVDMENWLPVQKHLKPIEVVTDKKTVYKELKKQGIKVRKMPVFPKAVIMCRISAHKFPSSKVMKIGMKHGVHYFKRISSAKYYSYFRRYLFGSESDLEIARQAGVRCGVVGGFPKLDPYLNQAPAKREAGDKPRILFTATYDKSGMSGIALWVDRLAELTEEFEVFVSVHPWTSPEYVQKLKNTAGITFIQGSPLPYVHQSDVCIVDTSSITAECCALDKPIISWKLPPAGRSVPEILALIADISLQIETFEELLPAIKRSLANPEEYAHKRAEANQIFYDSLDGKAGERSAQLILELLPELKP